jgi:hypothetical protein
MPVVNQAPSVPEALAAALEEPCVWPINTNCCPDWDTYDPQLQSDATAWATSILWALTGRRFGPCTIIVRPCGSTCNFGGGYFTYPVELSGGSGIPGTWIPFVDAAGSWRNCMCPGACSCVARCEVWLPGPVASVSSVLVDGVEIDPSAYRVDNGNLLVRQDGECWPECQDFNLAADSPETSENTFVVTYQRGTPVPVAGQIAAGLLACDFAKSCTTGCELPGNLSSLSRQGVEVTLADPTEELNGGLTGIPQVDQWIRAVNPNKLSSRARVRSLDFNMPRTVIGP